MKVFGKLQKCVFTSNETYGNHTQYR